MQRLAQVMAGGRQEAALGFQRLFGLLLGGQVAFGQQLAVTLMSWRAPQAWRAMVAPYSMSSGNRYRPLFGKYQTTASSMAPYSTPKKRLNTAAAGARKVAAEATTPHSTR